MTEKIAITVTKKYMLRNIITNLNQTQYSQQEIIRTANNDCDRISSGIQTKPDIPELPVLERELWTNIIRNWKKKIWISRHHEIWDIQENVVFIYVDLQWHIYLKNNVLFYIFVHLRCIWYAVYFISLMKGKFIWKNVNLWLNI